MTSLSLRLSNDLNERLARLAGTSGITTQECAMQALLEYVENWEGFNHTVAALQAEDERPHLALVVGRDA